MYKFLVSLFIISFVISFVISFASFFLSSKVPDKEKVSTFECGFNPMNYPGQPFSIRFFVIGILFLVFDIEISLLFPWSSFSSLINVFGQLILILFISILIGGLIYEFLMGGLEWE